MSRLDYSRWDHFGVRPRRLPPAPGAQCPQAPHSDRWDHFGDDDDEPDASFRPTRFDCGEGDAVQVQDVQLLPAEEVAALRRLEQPEMELWQIAVRKLRVWSAASEETLPDGELKPVRPYAVVVTQLYPSGRYLSHGICSPPERFPEPRHVLDAVVGLMKNPPGQGRAHRPAKVVLPDAGLVGALSKSFLAVGVECTLLSEADGLDDIVKEVSRALVANDVAGVGSLSETPGLLSARGVDEPLVRQLFEAAAAFFAAPVWAQIPERMCFSLRVAGAGGEEQVWMSVLGKQDATKGLALFYSLVDLESRLLPAAQLARLEDPRSRACDACGALQAALEGGKELKRCTRCRSAFYCNAQCQRGHWPRHRPVCTRLAARQPGDTWWAEREVSLLFEGPTVLPLDDHEAIDRHEWPVADELAGYPLPMVYCRGEPQRPAAADVRWLLRALRVGVLALERPDELLQFRLPDAAGEPVRVSAGGEELEVGIVSVLSVEEAEVVRRASGSGGGASGSGGGASGSGGGASAE